MCFHDDEYHRALSRIWSTMHHFQTVMEAKRELQVDEERNGRPPDSERAGPRGQSDFHIRREPED